MSRSSNFEKVLGFMSVAGQDQMSKNLEDNELIRFRLSLIQEEVDELRIALFNKDRKEVIDALADILYVVYGAGKAFDINLDNAFDKVHISNMTKFCQTEQEAIATVKMYKEQIDSRYDSVTYKKKDDYFVVYNESSGKILKSINYQPVNLDHL